MIKPGFQAMGWHRDLPDPRDYTPEAEEIAEMLAGLKSQNARLQRVDWRDYCLEVPDQQDLRASAAHACAGMLQFFQRRATGHLFEPSRLFIHKTARRLVGANGDTGTALRTTFKAIVRFGVPPEEQCPYDPEEFDQTPEPFAFSFSREFASIRYVRLDPRGKSGQDVLETVLSFVAAGFPCVFGFPVFSSISSEPEIPYPTIFDHVRGGQAVMALGYDDNLRFRSVRGALLVRNSWGPQWGDQGYGWLPYRYVREQLANDFWTIVDPEWLASGEFRNPIET